jgi:hypothetical protein
MQYLAMLKTDQNQYVCVSDTEAGAEQGIFDGHNTFVKMLMEAEYKNPLVDVTSEWLESRVKKYYHHLLGGPVSIETLADKWDLTTIEIAPDECYRNGSWIPRREQDY